MLKAACSLLVRWSCLLQGQVFRACETLPCPHCKKTQPPFLPWSRWKSLGRACCTEKCPLLLPYGFTSSKTWHVEGGGETKHTATLLLHGDLLRRCFISGCEGGFRLALKPPAAACWGGGDRLVWCWGGVAWCVVALSRRPLMSTKEQKSLGKSPSTYPPITGQPPATCTNAPLLWNSCSPLLPG